MLGRSSSPMLRSRRNAGRNGPLRCPQVVIPRTGTRLANHAAPWRATAASWLVVSVPYCVLSSSLSLILVPAEIWPLRTCLICCLNPNDRSTRASAASRAAALPAPPGGRRAPRAPLPVAPAPHLRAAGVVALGVVAAGGVAISDRPRAARSPVAGSSRRVPAAVRLGPGTAGHGRG